MRSRLFLLVLVAALAAPLAAGLAPIGAPTVAATHHVHMMVLPGGSAFVYDPPVLHVAPGDSVVFHSHDVLHTATSGLTTESEAAEGLAPGSAHLNSFDTGTVAGGQSRSVTIGEAGAFPYYCTVALHRLQGMHGLIVAA